MSNSNSKQYDCTCPSRQLFERGCTCNWRARAAAADKSQWPEGEDTIETTYEAINAALYGGETVYIDDLNGSWLPNLYKPKSVQYTGPKPLATSPQPIIGPIYTQNGSRYRTYNGTTQVDVGGIGDEIWVDVTSDTCDDADCPQCNPDGSIATCD